MKHIVYATYYCVWEREKQRQADGDRNREKLWLLEIHLPLPPMYWNLRHQKILKKKKNKNSPWEVFFCFHDIWLVIIRFGSRRPTFNEKGTKLRAYNLTIREKLGQSLIQWDRHWNNLLGYWLPESSDYTNFRKFASELNSFMLSDFSARQVSELRNSC